LKVVPRVFSGDQHHDQSHAFVGNCTVVSNPSATAPDRENVSAPHLHPDVGQRDAQPEVRRHRALTGEQSF
jgi:hypothetical protein